jgi:hypothetical protein
MTTLKETLAEDVKSAMRSGDRTRRDAIRMLLAAVKQTEVDQRTQLDDAQTVALLQKEAKRRQETIADFERAGRGDEAAGERAELAIIESYLPNQATEDEIAERARQLIAELGLSGSRAIGQLMKPLMAEYQGRADGRLINQVAQRLLKS